MKKLLTIIFMVGAGAIVYGQDTTGTIQWGNNYASSSFRSLIYGLDPADTGLAQVGQSSNTLEIPTGTTVYNGGLLSGTGYTFAFFAGPAGSPSNALTLYAQTTFRTGGGVGLVFGGTATIAGTVGGGQATFQIRVWDNQGGTLNTWAQAEAAWIAGLTDAGTSPLVLSGPLGGLDTNLNIHNPQVDSGWVSFNTHGVPEPATITLGALGAAGLLILRRNRKVN